ncbi:MAG: hypothetical protein IIC87_06605, partial [Chloroflexi bacterium]|nr:hypothetical protein [Chloroflexota bacterium]
MGVIGLGLVGFTAGMGFDLAAPWGFPRVRRVLGVVAGASLVAAHIMLVVGSSRLAPPGWVVGLGVPLLVVAAFLLVYSLFIELSFRSTYAGLSPGP